MSFLGAESLLTTVPGTVEQSLEICLRKLKEKREASGRPENVNVRLCVFFTLIVFSNIIRNKKSSFILYWY